LCRKNFADSPHVFQATFVGDPSDLCDFRNLFLRTSYPNGRQLSRLESESKREREREKEREREREMGVQAGV
jgi:hypothetical protein